MTKKARSRSYKSLSDCEQITDMARVAKLLERLAKQHNFLTVEIPGHRECYTSSIVAVDSSHILLDELLPTTGHKMLLEERSLQVTGKLDGVDIRFITTLERVDNSDNMITYHARLPGKLEYRQRRHDYRAHIPMTQTLRVVLDCRDGKVVEGVLHDLSHSGAGIIFPDGPPTVEHGQLHNCALELPEDVWLYCALELRHSESIPSRDRQLIGARFVKLSRPQQRLVGHSISKLEQEFIRKRVAD
ncbi:MAG: flagellar regulator YcgR PilZN domain-containing protein [Gammaproteobacteria bacterium]|jgi:c-di-GMP-binding flagellar brake protein YcgR